jgi:hypothetical protein
MLESADVSGARLRVVLACASLLALAALSPRLIPYCMDEFAHYHALGCAAFPLTQKWSAYREGSLLREGCGSYDLRLPLTDTFLPLRAYHYIGSLPALPFLPLWKALDDPVAARVQGALFLMLSAGLLARLSGARFLDTLLAACLFPVYALAHVVDLGPVGLSLALLGLALLGVRAAICAEGARSVAWAALSGLAVFLGFWTKLVFAWTIPALAIFAWMEGPLRRSLKAATIALAVAAAPSLLLLAAKDTEGVRYVNILQEGNFSVQASASDLGLHPFLRLSRYLYDGSAILPRTLALPRLPLDVVPLLLAATLLVLGRQGVMVRRFAALALVTGLATLLTRSVWGPHHAAFAFFFLVGALASALEPLRRRGARLPAALGLVVGLYWLGIGARLPLADVRPDTSFGKDALLRFVRKDGVDRRAVLAHTSWGTYYIGLLFGDRQQINLWLPALPVRPEMIAEVQRIAAAERRGVAVVSVRREPNLLTPALLAALSAPIAEARFGEWTLVEFGR